MTDTLDEEGLRIDLHCPSCGAWHEDPEAPHHCTVRDDEPRPYAHAGVAILPMDAEPPRGASYTAWWDQRYPARRGLQQALIRLRDNRDIPNCAGDPRPHSGYTFERQEVINYLCPSCPIREACHKAGEGERWGVWGGVDRTSEGPSAASVGEGKD